MIVRASEQGKRPFFKNDWLSIALPAESFDMSKRNRKLLDVDQSMAYGHSDTPRPLCPITRHGSLNHVRRRWSTLLDPIIGLSRPNLVCVYSPPSVYLVRWYTNRL
jgi:hypothetical protein